MLHFTCDLCGCELTERRFVARVEVYPAFDPEELGNEDLDVDHLEEIAEMIAEMEAKGTVDIEDCGPHEMRFDLCADCWRRFLKDPLGREALRRLNFS
ncbi:MAG: hypothetical protein GXP27_10220, partial [Planctomycetes bacterium]|nr:hypothetical protein [Planctomycetota bacterium]